MVHEMQDSKMLDLPTELIINILCVLDGLEIVRCTRVRPLQFLHIYLSSRFNNFHEFQVCKYFNEIIQGSVVLQYRIHLHLASYIDGPPSNQLSTGERLERLKNHEEAWRNVTWSKKDTYVVERQSPTYELYGGVYAQGLTAPWGGDSLVTRGMKLIEFPSPLRDSDVGNMWVIEDFGFDVKDFGMDPTQGLLVLMESVAPS